MKKYYGAVVKVYQKNRIDGIVHHVVFDFGDDLLQARNFVNIAEEALTRYEVYFEIRNCEVVRNDEDKYK